MWRALNHLMTTRMAWIAGALLLLCVLLMLGTLHLTLRELSDRQMQANAHELLRIVSGIRVYYASNVVQSMLLGSADHWGHISILFVQSKTANFCRKRAPNPS